MDIKGEKMKTLITIFALSLFTVSAQAQAKKESCKELSKREQVLVECTDQGHAFEKVAVTYQVLPLSECTAMAQAFVTISQAEGEPQRYGGEVFHLSDLEQFRTTFENPIALALAPVPFTSTSINENTGAFNGGIMVKLIRGGSFSKPTVTADLAINGQLYRELNCK
jgi:hypothetical protein